MMIGVDITVLLALNISFDFYSRGGDDHAGHFYKFVHLPKL